jgi:chromosome segregation ATPase
MAPGEVERAKAAATEVRAEMEAERRVLAQAEERRCAAESELAAGRAALERRLATVISVAPGATIEVTLQERYRREAQAQQRHEVVRQQRDRAQRALGTLEQNTERAKAPVATEETRLAGLEQWIAQLRAQIAEIDEEVGKVTQADRWDRA